MVTKSLKSLNKFFNKNLNKDKYYVIIGKDKDGNYFSAYIWKYEDFWIQDVAGEVRLYQHKYDDIGDCMIGLFNAELDAYHSYNDWIPIPCYDLEIYPYHTDKEMQTACKRMIELGMYQFIK